MFSSKDIIKESVSPYDYYCDGFKSPGASGRCYLGALILSIGKTSKKFSHKGSQTLDGILAYDTAESNSAYIGQINMTIVSSFLGPQGLIWGYDLAKNNDYKNSKSTILNKEINVPIYSTESIEQATISLFGTKENKHFPFLPGSHVPCAGRYFIKEGPAHIYCAIAIGIPKDRSKSAVLLMEDVGELIGSDKDIQKEKIKKGITESVLKIGDIHNIEYKEIFVGFKDSSIKKGEFGCALVAMPYFSLARKAIVNNDVEKMATISIQEWEKMSRLFFIDKKL